MQIRFEKYPFTSLLGWSSSRYDLFAKCKRHYFYMYYTKHVPHTSLEQLKRLKSLTSVPLEIGNVVHNIIETFLRRLQVSDKPIEKEKFLAFARTETEKMFTSKEFIELYYQQVDKIDTAAAQERVANTLANFADSPIYQWIVAIPFSERQGWLIEPSGFGETRLGGYKAYCKMDFLLPHGEELHILDWKTGQENQEKHSNQLIGYALAAQLAAPSLPAQAIKPRIIYMNPHISEMSVPLTEESLQNFLHAVELQTKEMYHYCADVENNTPRPMDDFPRCSQRGLCKYCPFQEVCKPFEAESSTAPLPF